jgi:hypothetical protein
MVKHRLKPINAKIKKKLKELPRINKVKTATVGKERNAFKCTATAQRR